MTDLEPEPISSFLKEEDPNKKKNWDGSPSGDGKEEETKETERPEETVTDAGEEGDKTPTSEDTPTEGTESATGVTANGTAGVPTNTYQLNSIPGTTPSSNPNGGLTGSAPPVPRSAKFNIYDTDQLDAGGVPFSEVFLEGFKFLGDNFSKTARTFTNAVLNVFSKPVSSMRVLGEAAIKYGQGASARIEQAYRKHGNAPWVQKTETEDLAAAQQAIMNTFISDISEVRQMDLDQLMDKVDTLSMLRDGYVDLNGTAFFGFDENGQQISPGALGLRDLVMYINGDPTCGGKYSSVMSTTDGRNYQPVTRQQQNQLKYYSKEYKEINNALKTELQIRQKDLYSERKIDEYNTKNADRLHRLFMEDPVQGTDHIEYQLSNGVRYKATPAQVLARERGFLTDKGVLNIEAFMNPTPTERNKLMGAINYRIATDNTLTDRERNQLTALWQICEISNHVVGSTHKMERRLWDDEKQNTVKKLFKEYLTDAATHSSLGDYGIDASDSTNTWASIFKYNHDLPTHTGIKQRLLTQANFEPGTPIYNEETELAVNGSPGARLAIDNGVTFALFGMGVNNLTRQQLANLLSTIMMDNSFKPEVAANRVMISAATILKDAFTSNPRRAALLGKLGFGSGTMTGSKLDTIMYDPFVCLSIDPDTIFQSTYTAARGADINGCTEYEKEYLGNMHLGKHINSIVSIISPTTNLPYDQNTSFRQIIEDYQELCRDPMSDPNTKAALESVINTFAPIAEKQMANDMRKAKIIISEAQEKLKSPMAVLRATELWSTLNVIGAAGVPADVYTLLEDMVMSYYESSDEEGFMFSPGVTGVNPTNINGQDVQAIQDKVGKTQRWVPIQASLGNEDLYQQTVDKMIDVLASIPAGRLATPDEAKRRITRLKRARAKQSDILSIPDSGVAQDVVKFSEWNPLNELDDEFREQFRVECTIKGKLGTLNSSMRSKLYASRTVPSDDEEYRTYMADQCAYLATSVEGYLAQLGFAYDTYTDLPPEYSVLSDVLAQLDSAYEENNETYKDVLEEILPRHKDGQIADFQMLSETAIRHIQYLYTLPISSTGEAKARQDKIEFTYYVLNDLMQRLECELTKATFNEDVKPRALVYNRMAFNDHMYL